MALLCRRMSYFGLLEVIRIGESVSEEECRKAHVLRREMEQPFDDVEHAAMQKRPACIHRDCEAALAKGYFCKITVNNLSNRFHALENAGEACVGQCLNAS